MSIVGRKRICTVALVALVATGLAQNPSPIQQPKTKLVVWGISFGPDSKGIEAVVREFERRNPDIDVRVVSMGAGGMDPQKLMTSIVGKVPPDVINQDRFTIGDWASRGAFMSLDEFAARDLGKDPLCPKKQDYYPATWAEASFDGKLYAIPTSADNRILYWNRTIFRRHADELRKAGLDPDRPPKTWSQVLAYSKILTERDKSGNIKVAGFLPNFGNSWLYMYSFMTGAKFMSDDGRTCTLYSKEAEEALQFMIDGYDVVGGYEKAQAFQSGFLQNQNDAFIVGKVAMKIDGDWILNSLSRWGPDLDFGVSPPPIPDERLAGKGRYAGEKEKLITWTGGFSYAIPTGARRPEEAWRFIKWATSPDARLVEARAQAAWERKRGREFIPRQSANLVANERFFSEFKPAEPNFAAALRQHIDLMPMGRIRPVTFVGQQLWDEHVRAMERACLKKMSPKEALLTGQRVVQRELDNYFRTDSYPIVDLRIPAGIGLAGLGCLGIVLFALYKRKRLGVLGRHEAKWGYILVSPWAIGFLVFTLGPMLASFFFSFTQYNVLSPARWVGLRNYADLAGADSPNVEKALSNVTYLAGIGVPLSLVSGLAVALLLNAAARGVRFYRTIFYMPAIVPTVASAVLWSWLLAGDPNKGLINAAWNGTVTPWLGVAPPGWINAESWAKPALIVMGVWGAGSGMILWLAGLKGVPTVLYEAASIDGATPRQQFWAITLPKLTPIIFFNTVMGFIGSIQEFDRIYMLRTPEGNPGPADSLLVPVYHLFRNAFNYFKMGYASSLAWLIFGIILGLTIIQFVLAPRWVHYES